MTMATASLAGKEISSAHAPEIEPDRSAAWLDRPRVAGKFLYVGAEKLWLKGVTYGTFRPDPDGVDYPFRAIVDRDFAAMYANGFNLVRTYTAPPRWLLDTAARHGLRIMVGLAWEQHVAFLDDRSRAKAIEQRVRAAARSCAGHPAVLGYTIGNEIPAPIVRWHGAQRIERFLKRLYRAVRAEDPEALVTYVNYPTTEYLQLPFLDLVCFNVYLESDGRLRPISLACKPGRGAPVAPRRDRARQPSPRDDGAGRKPLLAGAYRFHGGVCGSSGIQLDG